MVPWPAIFSPPVGTLLKIAQSKNRQNHEKNIQKIFLPTYLPYFFHNMKP
jgi:hypothetical protein